MKKYLLPVFLGVVLTACGDGGDVSTDPNNLSQQFVGTWQSGCYQNVDIKGTNGASVGAVNGLQTPTGSNLYAKKEMVISRVDNANLTFKLSYKVFAASDTTCVGTSLGSIAYTGLASMAEQVDSNGISSSYGSNTLAIAGTSTLSDGKEVTQLTLSVTKLLDGTKTVYAGNDGASHSGFGTTTGDFPAFSDKVIAYIHGSTMTLAFAEGSTTYPSAIVTTNELTYTKQ